MKPWEKLGKSQRGCLLAIADRNERSWCAGCGWIWGTHAETTRIMDSLVRAGWMLRSIELHPYRLPGYTRARYTVAHGFEFDKLNRRWYVAP